MICRVCTGTGWCLAGFAVRVCPDCRGTGTLQAPVAEPLTEEEVKELYRDQGEPIG